VCVCVFVIKTLDICNVEHPLSRLTSQIPVADLLLFSHLVAMINSGFPKIANKTFANWKQPDIHQLANVQLAKVLLAKFRLAPGGSIFGKRIVYIYIFLREIVPSKIIFASTFVQIMIGDKYTIYHKLRDTFKRTYPVDTWPVASHEIKFKRFFTEKLIWIGIIIKHILCFLIFSGSESFIVHWITHDTASTHFSQ